MALNVSETSPSAKSADVENIVVDEANDLTYVVMAPKILNDGELYRAIRVEILKRGRLPEKGARLIITPAETQTP